MTRIILIVLSLSCSYLSIAQINLKKVLQERDADTLKKYYENADEKRGYSSLWRLYREVIAGYSEGKVYFYDDKTERSFDIDFLSYRSAIFYWTITEYAFDNHTNASKTYGIDSFCDPTKFANFETNFATIYKVPLVRTDLFKILTYSLDGCGPLPKECYEMQKMVSTNDTASLQKWLRSANAEKQLYAIAESIALKKNYHHIDPETQRIIMVIGKKSGITSTCNGCLMYHTPIAKIVKDLIK